MSPPSSPGNEKAYAVMRLMGWARAMVGMASMLARTVNIRLRSVIMGLPHAESARSVAQYGPQSIGPPAAPQPVERFFGCNQRRAICVDSTGQEGIDVMPGAQQFQRFADLCIEMSRDTSDSERSAALINMAKTWRSLAAEAVRF